AICCFRRGVNLHWRAAAHEIAISITTVDTRDARPKLILLQPRSRICGARAWVWVRPRVTHHIECGVRCIFQWIIARIQLSFLYLPNLLADADHRFAEAIQLSLGLTLGWFNHETAGHGKRHGWSVETII